MTSITNLFNAILRALGQPDPRNRDFLIFVAFVMCGLSLFQLARVKRRLQSNLSSKSNPDRERLQNLSLRFDDLSSKLTTEVTNHERQLQVLLTKIDIFEQQLKKIRTSGGNLVFEFDSGENYEDRIEYLESLLLDMRDKPVPNRLEELETPKPTLELEDPDKPAPAQAAPMVPIADLLREPREQISKLLVALTDAHKDSSDNAFSALETFLKSQGFSTPVSGRILETLRKQLPIGQAIDPEKLRELLRKSIAEMLHAPKPKEKRAKDEHPHPHVMLIAGVNGANRIEISQRIAEQFVGTGSKPLITTCEPLDATRRDQLVRWGRETEVPLVLGSKRSKPSALTCKAVHTAQDNNFDVLIIDTVSGVEESAKIVEQLKSISAMVDREQPDVPFETLVVVDATITADMLRRVRDLKDSIGVTGLCVTNLSMTHVAAKLIALESESTLPVRFMMFDSGERALREFVRNEFVDALYQTH